MNYVDETTPATLMDKAIKGMLDDLDPYTVYWNEQEVEDARIKNSGTYTGIGATVRTLKDKIIVVEPIKDYPADKAGLKAGDEIIKIGDISLSDFDDDAGECNDGDFRGAGHHGGGDERSGLPGLSGPEVAGGRIQFRRGTPEGDATTPDDR